MSEFLNDNSIRRVLTWGRHYESAYTFDGLQWYIALTFSDKKSVWEIYGSNALPENWDAFWALLSKLLYWNDLKILVRSENGVK